MIKYKIKVEKFETETISPMDDYYYQEIIINQDQLVKMLLQLAQIREEEKQ